MNLLCRHDIARLWAEALANGSAYPISEHLHDGCGGYCALGLLQRIVADAGVIMAPGRMLTLPPVDWFWSMPHPLAVEAAGLNYDDIHGDPESLDCFVSGGEVWEIAGMNDAGKSFSYIARYVRTEVMPRLVHEDFAVAAPSGAIYVG